MQPARQGPCPDTPTRPEGATLVDGTPTTLLPQPPEERLRIARALILLASEVLTNQGAIKLLTPAALRDTLLLPTPSEATHVTKIPAPPTSPPGS